MVQFNPETEYLVRNNSEFFNVPEAQKPKVAEQIEISFGNADKSKTVTKKYGENNENTQTIYYDAQGKKLGSVSVYNTQYSNGETSIAKRIHTADADYFDNDNNGTIDRKDTDNVYNRKEQEDAACARVEAFLKKNNLKPNDLNRGDVMTLYSNNMPFSFDLDIYKMRQQNNLFNMFNNKVKENNKNNSFDEEI